METRHEFRDTLGRIGRNAAVFTGMKVAVRAGKPHCEMGYSTKACDDRRPQGGSSGRVADKQHVCGEATAQRGDEIGKRLAARLLLAVEDNLDVDLAAFGREVVAHAAEKCERLALVVVCTAAVNAIVNDCRLERRRAPLLEWIRRLHVVVTVDKHGRRALVTLPFGKQDRRRKRPVRRRRTLARV